MLPTIILLFLLLLISLLTLQIISSSTFMSQCLSPVALLVIFIYHESLNCYCCLVRTLNITRMMLWWNVHVYGVSCWLHFQLSRCSNDGISHYCFQRSSTIQNPIFTKSTISWTLVQSAGNTNFVSRVAHNCKAYCFRESDLPAVILSTQVLDW